MPTNLESDVHKTVDVSAVAVIVKKQKNLVPLLSIGLATARMHHGILTVFFISQADEIPDWWALPAEYDSTGIVVQSITGKNSIRLLIKQLATLKPVLLGMALDDTEGEERYLAGKACEPLLQQLNCPIFIVKSAADWSLLGSPSAFVPFFDDANTWFAITTALNVSPELRISGLQSSWNLRNKFPGKMLQPWRKNWKPA